METLVDKVITPQGEASKEFLDPKLIGITFLILSTCSIDRSAWVGKKNVAWVMY